MKMFLTRLGEGSRMVVTGDPTQDDLPPGTISGLIDAVAKLSQVETIGMVRFTNRDIVRHPWSRPSSTRTITRAIMDPGGSTARPMIEPFHRAPGSPGAHFFLQPAVVGRLSWTATNPIPSS
jgi:hypothetical protein